MQKKKKASVSKIFHILLDSRCRKRRKHQDNTPTLKNKEIKEKKRIRDAFKTSDRCVLDGEIETRKPLWPRVWQRVLGREIESFESYELLCSRMILNRFLYDWQKTRPSSSPPLHPAVRSGERALQALHFDRIALHPHPASLHTRRQSCTRTARHSVRPKHS
jgi:hypothetical protein